MHEALKPTCGFYVALNNAATGEMHTIEHKRLYLMGNRTDGNHVGN